MKPIKEIRSKEGALHFQRYRILETPWRNIYVHYIARSDEDDHQHSHPWDFTSIILKGGYEETFTVIDKTISAHVRRTEVRTYHPGAIVRHKAEEYHRIKLLAPTWTLVITGPRKEEEWGYLTEVGKVDHKAYRQAKRLTERQRAYICDKTSDNQHRWQDHPKGRVCAACEYFDFKFDPD